MDLGSARFRSSGLSVMLRGPDPSRGVIGRAVAHHCTPVRLPTQRLEWRAGLDTLEERVRVGVMRSAARWHPPRLDEGVRRWVQNGGTAQLALCVVERWRVSPTKPQTLPPFLGLRDDIKGIFPLFQTNKSTNKEKSAKAIFLVSCINHCVKVRLLPLLWKRKESD